MEIPCSQESQETIIQAFGKAVEFEYAKQNSTETPPRISNIQILVSILKRFRNITVVGKNQQKIFVEDLLKYIEIIMIFLSGEADYRRQQYYASLYMSFIPDIFKTVEFKNIFVQGALDKTLDLFTYGCFNLTSKQSLLTVFNGIALASDKKLRNEVANRYLYCLYNFIDCLSAHGDFALQADIVETLFRIYGTQIKEKKFDLLPGSDDLGKALKELLITDFDGNVRIWLNKFNLDSKHIFSIACKRIMFGSEVCPPPKGVKEMWVDFNIKESMLSFYSDSLSAEGWSRPVILAKDVKKVEVIRKFGPSESMVSIEMNRSCISDGCSIEKHGKLDKHVKLIVANDDNEKEKISKLITVVLPKIFGDTFSHLSYRITSKPRNVYKPLSIKVSRYKSGSSGLSIDTTTSRSNKSDVSTVEVMVSKERNSAIAATDGVPNKYSSANMCALSNNEDITVTDFTRLSCLSSSLADHASINTSDNLDILSPSKPASPERNSAIAATDGVPNKYSSANMCALSNNEDITVTDFTRLSCLSSSLADHASINTSDNLDILSPSKPASPIETRTSRSNKSDIATVEVMVPIESRLLDDRNSATDGVPNKFSSSKMRALSHVEDTTVSDFTRLSCLSPSSDHVSINTSIDVENILPSSKPASPIGSDNNCYRKIGERKLQDNIISSSHGDGETAPLTHESIEILSGRCSGRSANYHRLVSESNGFHASELFSSSPVKVSRQKSLQDVSSEFSAPSSTNTEPQREQIEVREICETLMSDEEFETAIENINTDQEYRSLEGSPRANIHGFIQENKDNDNECKISKSLTQIKCSRTVLQNDENADNVDELNAVNSDVLSDNDTVSFKSNVEFLTEDLDGDTQNNKTIVDTQEVSEERDSRAIFSSTQVVSPQGGEHTEDFTNVSLAVNVGILSESQLADKPVSKHSKILMEANEENIIDLTIDDVERETNSNKKKIESNANKENVEQILPKSKYMWNTPQLLDCLEEDIHLQEKTQKDTKTIDCTIKSKDAKKDVGDKEEIVEKNPKTKNKKARTSTLKKTETTQKNTKTIDCTIKSKDAKTDVGDKEEIVEKKLKTKNKKPRTLIKTGKKRFDLEKVTESQNIQDNLVTNKKDLNEIQKHAKSPDSNRIAHLRNRKELQTASCPEVSSKESNTIQENDGLQSWEKTKENVEQICEKTKESGERISKKTKEYGEGICEKTNESGKQIYEKTEKDGKQNCKKSKQSGKKVFEKAKENEAVSEEEIPLVSRKEPFKHCIRGLNVVLEKMNFEQQEANSSSGLASQLAPEMNSDNVGNIEDGLNKTEGKIEASGIPTRAHIARDNTSFYVSEAPNVKEHEGEIRLSEFILKKGARPLPETQDEVSPDAEKVSTILRKTKKGKVRKATKLQNPKANSSANDQPENIKPRDLDIADLPAKVAEISPKVGQKSSTPTAIPDVGLKLVINPNPSPDVGLASAITSNAGPDVRQNLALTSDSSPDVGFEIITTIAEIHEPPRNKEPDQEAGRCNRTTLSQPDSNEALSQEFKNLEEMCRPIKRKYDDQSKFDEILVCNSPVLTRTRSSERIKQRQPATDAFEDLFQNTSLADQSRKTNATSGNKSRRLFNPLNLSYLDEMPAISEQKTPDSDLTPTPVVAATKPKRNKRAPKDTRKAADKIKTHPKEKSPKETAKSRSKPRPKRGKKKQFEFSHTDFKTLDEMFDRACADLGTDDRAVRWNNHQPMDIAVRRAYSSSDDSPVLVMPNRNAKNVSPPLPIIVSSTTPSPLTEDLPELEIETCHRKEGTGQRKINIQQHIIIPPKRPRQGSPENKNLKRRRLTAEAEEAIPVPEVPLEEPAAAMPTDEVWVKVVKLFKFIISLVEKKSPNSLQKIDELFKQIE